MSVEEVVEGAQMALTRRRQTPDQAIAEGQERAKALMDIVRRGKISVQIEGREYLKVEAWQTLARFNGCWIDTEWTKDIRDANTNEVIGVEARARLVSIENGQSFGGAEGACMLNEELDKRDGTTIERWSDYYAVRSMAQTRAQGKVGRMAFAWIAVLAGYEGTPAEEMGRVVSPDVVCPKCGKPAIIKGRMEFGGGWVCYKKKGGCGAKWTDAEWAIVNAPPPTAAPEQTYSEPLTTLPATAVIEGKNEMRSVLLGRIQAQEDKKQIPPLERIALWRQYCGEAVEDNVDPAALQELYGAVLKR